MLLSLELKNCIVVYRGAENPSPRLSREQNLSCFSAIPGSRVILSSKPSEYKSLCIKSESKNVFPPLRCRFRSVALNKRKNCLMDREKARRKDFSDHFSSAMCCVVCEPSVVVLFTETPFNKRLIDWCCECVFVFATLDVTAKMYRTQKYSQISTGGRGWIVFTLEAIGKFSVPAENNFA